MIASLKFLHPIVASTPQFQVMVVVKLVHASQIVNQALICLVGGRMKKRGQYLELSLKEKAAIGNVLVKMD